MTPKEEDDLMLRTIALACASLYSSGNNAVSSQDVLHRADYFKRYLETGEIQRGGVKYE